MKKSRAVKFSVTFFSLAAIIGVTFSNCSKFGLHDSSEMSSLLPPEHPPLENTDPGNVQVKAKLVDRDYVATLFREIFTADPNAHETWAEDLILIWLSQKGGYWGGACNTYDTYGNQDCAAEAANSKQQVVLPDTTIRQSYLLQICDNFIGSTNGFANLKAKLPLGPDVMPNAGEHTDENPRYEMVLKRLWYLFYRRDAEPAAIDLLKQMDAELTKAGVPWDDRLRLLSVQVCQSPGWQVL